MLQALPEHVCTPVRADGLMHVLVLVKIILTKDVGMHIGISTQKLWALDNWHMSLVSKDCTCVLLKQLYSDKHD